MVDDLRNAGSGLIIDRDARLLIPELIDVGSNVRIDAGVLIAGRFPVSIGDFVHLAAGTKIFASGAPVRLSDFTALASDVKVYTATDDYTDGFLTNPTVPDEFRNVSVGPVVLEEHAIVGAGSVLLPGSTLGFGSSVGALSLVRGEVHPGEIVAGSPARVIGHRDLARLRQLSIRLRAEVQEHGGQA